MKLKRNGFKTVFNRLRTVLFPFHFHCADSFMRHFYPFNLNLSLSANLVIMPFVAAALKSISKYICMFFVLFMQCMYASSKEAVDLRRFAKLKKS